MSSHQLPVAQLLEKAVAHHQAGRLQEAEGLYRQVLSTDPEQPDALYLLGVIAQICGHHKDAVELVGRATRARPSAAQYHITLGQALASLQQLDRAVDALREAVRLEPRNPDAQNGLGITLDMLGAREDAVAAFRAAISAQPEFAVAHFNLGNSLHQMGRLEESVAAYRTALRLEPADLEIHNNLGVALMDQLQTVPAIEAFDRALALNPRFAPARMNKSLALLLTERFEEGWQEHESRHEATNHALQLSRPWKGEPLANRTLYVHPEQGAGDSINFVRFLPMLAERGAQITMRVPPALLDLFNQSDLRADFVTRTGDEDASDYQVALLGIPPVVGTDRASIPLAEGYLRAAPDKVRAYQDAFFRKPKLKVGFVWQGNPKQRADRQRSVPLASLLPLLTVPGIEAYSLQKGEAGERQLAELPAHVALTALGQTFSDFSDTAAALANLDLLISTCTSVPHLAGALGKPTWLMLAYHPDWRWFLNDEASPWYRSLRLFRQPGPGDWAEVVERMRIELEAMVSDASVRTASSAPPAV